MPPKKAIPDPLKDGSPGEEATPAKESTKEFVSIEDHSLPKSIVTRLAKGVLPANTQIQANATLAITKGATVFVNYLASHANEICQREGRKTVNPHDVLRALDELEFPDFKPRLEAELAKFNEIQSDKRSNAKAKKASEKTAAATESATGAGGTVEQTSQASNTGEPASKKARTELEDRIGGDQDAEDSFVSAAEGRKDDTDVEEDEEVEDEEDTLEVDEAGDEEVEERDDAEEEEDEALDNGGDSD